jgi:hypothetical protein
MALPKRPFDNKFHFDSGRLIHPIAIMNYAVSDDGYGGTTVTEQQLLATKAGKDEVSDYKKAQLVEGFTNYETAIYFVIRNRKLFYPDKTMHINYAGKTYTIISVKELDDPCTFLKILCVVST